MEGLQDVGALDELPWPYSLGAVELAKDFLFSLQQDRETDIAPMASPDSASPSASTAAQPVDASQSLENNEGNHDASQLITSLQHTIAQNNNFLDCTSPSELTTNALAVRFTAHVCAFFARDADSHGHPDA